MNYYDKIKNKLSSSEDPKIVDFFTVLFLIKIDKKQTHFCFKEMGLFSYLFFLHHS